MMILGRCSVSAAGWPLLYVTTSSQRALLSDIRACLAAGQGFSVATMNLDHVVKLRRDPAFRRAYGDHSHITADGRPIVWMSALAGRPVDLVTGSDLLEPLVDVCAQTGSPVAFLGSTQEILDRAAERLQARHPDLDLAELIAPPMGFDPEAPEAEILFKKLAQSGAKVCILALGAPKQEIFAARAAQALPEMGFVSVGAGVDFVAGAQRRAPKAMRAIGMEWIWRLAGNPRRLMGRYAACIGVLPALMQAALAYRFGQRAEAPE